MTVPAPCSPQRTTVVVVGVEEYAAGSAWSLPGPADDARRFVDWFVSRGVPPERITALVSPLRGNVTGWAGSPVAPRPATHEQVRSALVREVATAQGELLWVVWGGHGLVDGSGHRRLFCADATSEDPLNVDVDEVLALHRSEAGPTFGRQIWMVDACQTFHDAFANRRDLPHERFAAGPLLPGRHQEVLFAASPGELAVNLPSERTGLFSREVLEDLRRAGEGGACEVWPPDIQQIAAQARHRFLDLRRAGRTRQTPTYLWYRNRDGDEGQLLHAAPSAPAPAPAPPPPMTMAQRTAIVNALMAVPELRSLSVRDQVIGLMRVEAAGAIPRSAAMRIDIAALERTCERFPGALAELLDCLTFYVGDTPETVTVAAAIGVWGHPPAGQ